jgi:transcriptional regulator with XRE-family HTH domain
MKNLKALREAKNVSQQKLADKIGTNQQNIHRYENGYYEPDINTLKLLADFFETSIDYLVGATDIKNKIEPTSEYNLNDEEGATIKRLRQLSPRQRQGFTQVLDMLLDE